MMKPDPERLILLLGGPAKISRGLGTHESGVSRWTERGIPNHHAIAVLGMATQAANIARRTKTMIECKDGQSYGAERYMAEVRKALGVEICPTCKQVVQ